MWDYKLLSIIFSALALGTILAAAPLLRRRLRLFHLVIAFVSGLVAGTLVTLVLPAPLSEGLFSYLPWPGFEVWVGYNIALRNQEILVATTLFLLCLIGLLEKLHPSKEADSDFFIFYLSPFVFSVTYAGTYVLITHYPEQLDSFVTFIGVSIAGLFGVLAYHLLTLVRPFPTISLPPKYPELIGRFLLATFLMAGAILLPLRKTDSALAYGIVWQTDEGPVTKWWVEIDSYDHLAGYFLERGDIGTALILSQQAIRADPDSHSNYIRHADLLMRTGQYEAAIAELDIAVSLVPTDTTAYYGQALAYEALGDYDAAIQNLNQIFALQPALELEDDIIVAYIVHASLSIHKGEYAQAIADINELLELEAALSSQPLVLLLKGIAYLGQQDVDSAQLAMANWGEESIGIEYESDGIITSTGTEMLQFDFGFGTTAMAQTTAGERYYQRYQPSFNKLSFDWYSTDFIDYFAYMMLAKRFASNLGALEYMTPALEKLAESSLADSAAAVYRSLGLLYASQNQPKASLSYYQQAVEVASNSGREPEDEDLAEIYYNLALLNLEDGQIEDAIDNLSQALKYNPNHKDALFTRAQVYFDTSQFTSALADMQQVVQLDPSWTEAQVTLGYYLAVTGQYKQAIDALVAIDPPPDDNPLYYHYLGYAYAGNADRSSALSAYDNAFQLISAQWSHRLKASFYEQIVEDLVQLVELDANTADIVRVIWVMIRGAMAADEDVRSSLNNNVFQSSIATYYQVDWTIPRPYSPSTQVTTTVQVPTQTVTSTSPVTQTLWLQLAAVGPDKIRPGSSGIFQIVAELRQQPNLGDTAFPIELYVGNTYSIEARLDAVNFEVGGETEPAALRRPLEIGEPIHWQWTISPKPGYEGNQHVAYSIVVRDSNDTGWFSEIPVGSVVIAVPTRYGIPPQVLYPLSGLAAFLGATMWKTLLEAWKEYRKRAVDKPRILMGKK